MALIFEEMALPRVEIAGTRNETAGPAWLTAVSTDEMAIPFEGPATAPVETQVPREKTAGPMMSEAANRPAIPSGHGRSLREDRILAGSLMIFARTQSIAATPP